MKKIVSIVSIALVVLMLAATLTACGGSDSPEGKYVIKSIDGESVDDALKSIVEQQSISAEEFLKQAGINSAEEIYTLELKSDGKAVLDAKLFSTKLEGTWKQNGDKIELTMEGVTQVFTKKGNELSNDEGDQKFVFVKK